MEEKILVILESLHPEHDYRNSKDYIGGGLLDSFDMVALIANMESDLDVTVAPNDIIPENFANL